MIPLPSFLGFQAAGNGLTKAIYLTEVRRVVFLWKAMFLDEILCGMKIDPSHRGNINLYDPSKQKDFLPVESRSFLALIGML